MAEFSMRRKSHIDSVELTLLTGNMTGARPDGPRETSRKRYGVLATLRVNFLAGLVVVAPIAVTVWVFWTAIGIVDSWVLPLIPEIYRPTAYTDINIRGVGVIIFLIFTVVVGWVAKGLFGRFLLRWWENIVDRVPLIRSVYNVIKQIAETVVSQSSNSFDRPCLVEYPRKGSWAIGFYSSHAKGEIRSHLEAQGEIISVFMPTTPNPTSGFVLFIPERDVIYLDMGVEDAAKLVISAGLIYPPSIKD